MSGYPKLFPPESRLMKQPLETRYVYFMLLAIAEQGHVIGTDIAIARRINLPLETFKSAVAQLRAAQLITASDKGRGHKPVQPDAERGAR